MLKGKQGWSVIKSRWVDINKGDEDRLNYRSRSLESIRDIDSLQDLEHYPELLALIASS